MNIYERKNRWKLVLFLFALSIVLATMWYTSQLAREVALEEKNKVEQLAAAYEYVLSAPDEANYDVYVDMITSNRSVPIIWTDSAGAIMDYINLDSARVASYPGYLERQLEAMRRYAEPITLEVVPELGTRQYLYYNHSTLYSKVRFFPLFMLGIIGLFLFAAYLMFSTARRAEQNRVWVGMAKETAHQLGTPISSLSGWIEYLRESPEAASRPEVLDEMTRDMHRLELITERFSKVGSAPDLTRTDLAEVLDGAVDYIRTRASRRVELEFTKPEANIYVNVNVPLFEWVIENLLKNALDAIEGEGRVAIQVEKLSEQVAIDVEDSGKGIPKSLQRTVFEPGFSTKKRGWGLGLTLVKRIVENYHAGKIFVKQSSVGKGTTFRILLPYAS